MKLDQRTGLMLLSGALVMGFLAEWLFSVESLGLNLPLWVATILSAWFWLHHRQADRANGDGRWLLPVALGFSGLLVLRDSEILQFLDVLAILLCLGLATAYARQIQLRRAGVVDYAIGLAVAGAHVLAGPLPVIFGDIQWQSRPKGRYSAEISATLRGLLLALPFLLLFGALFAAADPVFAKLLDDLIQVDLSLLPAPLFRTAVWSWLSAGLLRSLLLGGPNLKPVAQWQGRLALGRIETGLIFGLLGILFLAFVLVQFRYFFGGENLVEASTGWTYADYARRGFFELVTVSVLLLPVLLAGQWLQPADSPGQQRLFRRLALVLVGNLAIIMTSALQRMLLYQREFGLSELRLYTIAFMLWLALLFGWFVLTVLRGHRERFAFGALVAGLSVLAGLHLLNPDALIAKTNLARMESGRSFDAEYAAQLSADAVPVLLEALPRLPEAEREMLAQRIQQRFAVREQPDWRGWNLSRARAWKSVSGIGNETWF